MGIGGLGIGDWGLGVGPNPQSPIFKIKFLKNNYIYLILFYFINNNKIIIYFKFSASHFLVNSSASIT